MLVSTYNNQKNRYCTVEVISPASHIVVMGGILFAISLRHGYDHTILVRIDDIKFLYTMYVNDNIQFKSSKKLIESTNLINNEMITSLNEILLWCWPISGEISSTYSKHAVGRKGINIFGKSGQSVIAAASGKVVYSGNGPTRYGNIIIIQHNDVYLSTYAHNKILLVIEGQQVEIGQKIALLGQTGIRRDILYFEIRRNGRPVDPIIFLPRQLT